MIVASVERDCVMTRESGWREGDLRLCLHVLWAGVGFGEAPAHIQVEWVLRG